MRRLQVVLKDETEDKLKEMIFQTKGMKKGNISEAIEEAIHLWIDEQERKLAEEDK